MHMHDFRVKSALPLLKMPLMCCQISRYNKKIQNWLFYGSATRSYYVWMPICNTYYVKHTHDSVSANIVHLFKSFRLDFSSFAPFTTFNFHPFVRCCFSTAMFWNISFILPVFFSSFFVQSMCISSFASMCLYIFFCLRYLNGWHFMSTKFSNNSKKENDIKIVC